MFEKPSSIQEAKKLIEQGYLEECLNQGQHYSPLHHAANDGDLNTVKTWIDAGASVDLSFSTNHRTPLYCAIINGHRNVAEYLIDNHADLTARNYVIVAMMNKLPLDFLEHLLASGATLLGDDIHFKINLHEALSFLNDSKLFNLIEKHRPVSGKLTGDCIKALSNEKTNNEIMAERFKHLLQILLDNLSTEEVNTTYQDTPLFIYALQHCDEEQALLMLDKGADPNAVTNKGVSALHLAVFFNYNRLAERLIESGTLLRAKDYLNATPFNHALSFIRTLHLAEKMLAKEAGEYSNLFYAYNSVKQLNLQARGRHFDCLMNDTQIHDKWKNFYLIKLIAHLFGSGSVSTLVPFDGGAEKMEFYREGLTSPMKMLRKMGNATSKITCEWPGELKNSVIDLLIFSSKNAAQSSAEYLKRINEGKPTLVLSGRWWHAFYILFYQSNFVVCDSIENHPTFLKYNQESLTEKILDLIRYECSYLDNDYSIKSITMEIARIIELKKNPLAEAYEKYAPSKQPVGNCTWKSLEFAVSSLLILESPDSLDQVEILMRSWTLGLKLYFVNRYLEMHEENRSRFKPDYDLLIDIRDKLKEECLNETEKEKSAPVLLRVERLYGDKQRSNNEFPIPSGEAGFSQFLYFKESAKYQPYENLLKDRKKNKI